jgi:phosphoglycerate dehydrogenase-like enzyme
LPDNKFIITPHTAYGSKEAKENMNSMVIENIKSFLEDVHPKYKLV